MARGKRCEPRVNGETRVTSTIARLQSTHAHESTKPDSTADWIVIAASAATFWLLMMCVHEGGHAAGAWVTGGRVTAVSLSPLALSRTDVAPNPAPLTVAWCGPLIGAAVPALVGSIALLARWPLRGWLKAFAGFCLIANGIYLASGTIVPAGDTQDLMRLGATPFTLAVVGLSCAVTGLWIWHRLGPRWGLAPASAEQTRRWALQSTVTLAIVTAAMFLVDHLV